MLSNAMRILIWIFTNTELLPLITMPIGFVIMVAAYFYKED